MAAWNDHPEVLSPVGRSFANLMEEGPRRQDMPGYEPVYRDFVDYIIRCTHRIWEEKNIGLCRSHYSADCVMHTLAGPQVGSEIVVQNTIGALATSSDRQVIGEDVIWSDEATDACTVRTGSSAVRRISAMIPRSVWQPGAKPG